MVVPQSQSPDGQLADVGPLALPVEHTLLYEHHPQAATSLQLTQSLYWLHASDGAAQLLVPQSQSPAGQLADVGPAPVPVEHRCVALHHPHCTWPRRQTTATLITMPRKQTKKNAQPSRTWFRSLQLKQSVYWLHVSLHVLVPQSQYPAGQPPVEGPELLPVEHTLLYEHHPQTPTSLQLMQSVYRLHVSVGAVHVFVPQSQSPDGQLAVVGPTLVPVEHCCVAVHHPHCTRQTNINNHWSQQRQHTHRPHTGPCWLQVVQSPCTLHVSVGAAQLLAPQSQSPAGQLAAVGPLPVPVEHTLLYEHHPHAATSLQLVQSLYWLHVSLVVAAPRRCNDNSSNNSSNSNSNNSSNNNNINNINNINNNNDSICHTRVQLAHGRHVEHTPHTLTGVDTATAGCWSSSALEVVHCPHVKRLSVV